MTYRDRRRLAPFFVARWSAGSEAILHINDLHRSTLAASLRLLSDRFERDGLPHRSTNFALNETTRLGVVRLSGDVDPTYAVFVESVTTRASIEVMIDRYRLTRREAEVLVLSWVAERQSRSQTFSVYPPS